MEINWGEWWEARDRAMGRAENEIAFFTSIFEATPTTSRPMFRHISSGSLHSTPPPPYTP
jgi:hypothetical protein